MRRCPQCREELDERWFQAPVKTCLACYVSLPHHEHLLQQILEGRKGNRPEQVRAAWEEVRGKAASSKYARKKRMRERKGHMALKEVMEPGEMVREEIAREAFTPGVAYGLLTCDGCGKMVESPGELDNPSEEKALVCKACAAEPPDKRCSLCMKLFPLVSLYMHEGRAYCSDDISTTTAKSPIAAIMAKMRGGVA